MDGYEFVGNIGSGQFGSVDIIRDKSHRVVCIWSDYYDTKVIFMIL